MQYLDARRASKLADRSEKKKAKLSAARARAARPDEESFPPVAEFGLRGKNRDHEWTAEENDPRSVARYRALMSPSARQRRALFAKYVAGAVGFSLLVCAAAAVKTALSSADGSAASSFGSVKSSQSEQRATSPATPRAREPTPPVSAGDPVPPPAAPLEAEIAAKAVTASAQATTVPSSGSATVTAANSAHASSEPEQAQASGELSGQSEKPSPSASKQREASRRALERGDLDTAIAAGERSVALDPTDGEAWLVLGAAYQARGELAQAKRCYRACLDQGQRGPKAECRAMIQ